MAEDPAARIAAQQAELGRVRAEAWPVLPQGAAMGVTGQWAPGIAGAGPASHAG